VEDLNQLAKKTTTELQRKQQELERSEAGRRAREDELYVKVAHAARPSLHGKHYTPCTTHQKYTPCHPSLHANEGRAIWTSTFAFLEGFDVCWGCKEILFDAIG
jgi:hypothetical protein